jgi:hypothetical protein
MELFYETKNRIIIYSTELDGPAVSALGRAIVEVKQRRSVIGWMTKNLLSRVPCFGLVPAAFAVVSTHQSALGLRGRLCSLCIIHKKGLCPSSGDINGLMMMMLIVYV